MLGSGLGVGNFLSSPDDFVSRPISRPNVVASTPILEGLTGPARQLSGPQWSGR